MSMTTVNIDRSHNSATAAAAYPTSRRQRRKADTRQRIIDAAMRLFTEKGFDGVSVDSIVAAADVAKGTFFNYFPTKVHVLEGYRAAMLNEILANGERLARMTERLARRAGGDGIGARPMASVSSRELFKKWFGQTARIFRREDRLFDMMVRQAFADTQMHEFEQAAGPRIMQVYRKLLNMGVQRGELRANLDFDLVIEAMGNLWLGTLRDWVLGGRKFSLERNFARKIDLLFSGLLR